MEIYYVSFLKYCKTFSKFFKHWLNLEVSLAATNSHAYSSSSSDLSICLEVSQNVNIVYTYLVVFEKV